MIRYIIIFLVIVIEVYSFQVIKTLTGNGWIRFLYVLPTLMFFAFFVLLFINKQWVLDYKYVIGFAFSFIVLKLFAIPFLLGEDCFRVFSFLSKKIVGTEMAMFPSRRKFISQLALGVAAIPFAGLIYGMVKGKYDFRVLKYTLEFDDLPSEFDGFTITQISDIHCGSFDNREKVDYAIDLVNEQNSDMICFTGDLVNDRAVEVEPWKDVFSKLSAKEGVYSILGNHDYGDYYKWDSKEKKQQNLETLKATQKELGFDLLLNDHRVLERNGQCINLIGVENWGSRGFKKKGDLDKALKGVSNDKFKILLSHDPSHWEKKVLSHKAHIHLTLSGHTHGMQFGIEIPGVIKWSPSQWMYKYWAGLYKESGKYINVNRGLGFIGFPGRAGIWPEISVITLKKKKAILY